LRDSDRGKDDADEGVVEIDHALAKLNASASNIERRYRVLPRDSPDVSQQHAVDFICSTLRHRTIIQTIHARPIYRLGFNGIRPIGICNGPMALAASCWDHLAETRASKICSRDRPFVSCFQGAESAFLKRQCSLTRPEGSQAATVWNMELLRSLTLPLQ
jgi:hypothetical protein